VQAAVQVGVPQDPPRTGRSCGDLAKLNLPNTTITAAEDVAAGAFSPPNDRFTPAGAPAPYRGLPPFCRIAGSIAPVPESAIRFEVWLPETWNGKFVGVGNGGTAGFIFYPDMADPLRRGYAVGATDTGHSGGMADWSFVAHREKLIDNGYRAVREMTAKSKAVVETHYGSGPSRSYWNGCSTGGRQGLVAAHRFPKDYDGIIARAPAIKLTLQPGLLIEQSVMDRIEPLTPEKLRSLTEAAIAACGGADGVRDRTVTDPTACMFDPGVLACKSGDGPDCLTPHQVTRVRQIYRGSQDLRSERLSSGLQPTSESNWLPPPFASEMGRIATSYFQHVVFKDPTWEPSRLNLDAAIARARNVDDGVSTVDPDLRAFVQRGGKLLLWHGWSDGAIAPFNTIDYYNDVMSTVGKIQGADQIRLFMAPGVQHCGGGEGPWQVDYLSVLEQWVEGGKAPERLITSRRLEGAGQRSRPLCPYPQMAIYTGKGNSDEAGSFVCSPAPHQP
jgi:feruloyl esterase